MYNKLYEAYKKANCEYCDSLSKAKIQRNVNELWKSSKEDKSSFPTDIEIMHGVIIAII